MSQVAYGRLAKKLFMEQIETEFRDAKDVFVTRFSHVKSNALNELRSDLSKNKTRMRLIKNSLGRKVLEAAKQMDLQSLVDGNCALNFSNGDASATAKILVKFSETNKHFLICGAAIDGKAFDAANVKYLASLPSRQELLARVLGGMQVPISSFVYLLNGVASSFVRVLERIRESKGK